MPATNTYDAIQSYTLTSATNTVTFGSIPQTYTDLVLVHSTQLTGNVNVWMQFNSDTGTNYSITLFEGNGSTAASAKVSNQTRIQLDSTAFPPFSGSAFAPNVLHIMNYSNSTTYKSVLSRSNNAASGVGLFAGLWRSTSPITSIALIAGAVNFASGSTFSLYGIKAA